PTVRRLDTDASAAELDELFHDRETDARAATRSVARLLDTVEALEHVGQVGRRDALTGVAHPDDDIAAVARRCEGYEAAVRCVADRVLQQVREDLSKVVGVRSCRQTGGYVHADRDAAPLESRQRQLDGHLDRRPHVERHGADVALAVADSE